VSKPGKCFIILNQVASNGLMVRLTFEKELKDATKKKTVMVQSEAIVRTLAITLSERAGHEWLLRRGRRT
jgi:hypothetical protein